MSLHDRHIFHMSVGWEDYPILEVAYLSFSQNIVQLIIPRTKLLCMARNHCWLHRQISMCLVRYGRILKLQAHHQHLFYSYPLFMLSNHSFIHKQYLINHNWSLIAAIGLNPANCTGHSFRVGAATQANINHLPEFHIHQLCHWKSNVYKTYIHTPLDQTVNYSTVLAN